MPGLLAMEQQPIAIDSLESNSDRAHVRPPDGADASVQEKKTQLNGLRPHDSTEQTTDQPTQPNTNGIISHGAIAPGSNSEDAPPILDNSWRATPANKPFGTLLDRMAQMCYTDLQELVSKLSEEQIREDVPQVNGGSVVTTDDTSIASVKKKRLLLDFASTWRERFVKALVISDWSRTSGEDVAKIIDLRATLMDRVMHMEQAIQSIGDLKRDTVGSRMPALDLKGAMQYLNTGKSTYPDLGVLKSPPLTATQILELLEEMGTVANLRLCLEEPALPYHMTEYTIANGRVTFKCPTEFQVDLSCLDQDLEKSPWYFIDFRFDFIPAPSQISDEIRAHLEATINNATLANGLQGCYDFCHAFVLDQKLVEIGSQAYNLMSERWANVLAVQRMRRIVTIQYWTKRKAGKPSWIEFGVKSGKDSVNASLSSPSLTIRWFKEGTLVEDVDLDMDWSSINLEQLLFNVVRKHSTAVLKQIQDDIEKRNPTITSNVRMELLTHPDNPYGVKLVAHLPTAHGAANDTISCSVGPYTGLLSLTPRSSRAQDVESKLDREAEVTGMTPQLEHFICAVIQGGLQFEARLQQWLAVHDISRPSAKDRKTLFGTAVETTFWKPRNVWSDSYVLTYSTSMQSSAWHVVQLESTVAGRQIKEATKLEVDDSAWDMLLEQVVFKAVEQVQSRQLTDQARRESIPFIPEHFSRKLRLTSNYIAQSTGYFFDIGDLVNRLHKPPIKTWTQGRIGVSPGTLTSFGPDHGLIRHEVRLTIRPGQLTALQAYFRARNTHDIVINSEGGLAVVAHVPLGTSCLSSVGATLLSIARVDCSIAVLQRLSMDITEMNLHHIRFTYGPQHKYSMRLTYAKHGMTPVRLKVNPKSINPHHRIRVSLEQLLNGARQDVFDIFAHVLTLTLPLLLAVEKIETTAAPGDTFAFHVRHATWYSLKYQGTVTASFTIRARARLEGTRRAVKWHVEQDRQRPGSTRPLPDGLVSALKGFWAQPGIDGVVSLRTGLATGAGGIAALMEKLHGIVSPFLKPVEAATASSDVPAQAAIAKTEASAVKKERTDKQDVIMLD